MHAKHLTTWIFMLASMLSVILPASAQTYTCKQSNGTYAQSNRPCDGNPGMVYYPPVSPSAAPTSPRQSYYAPSIPKSQDFVQYMSARCSGMHDAIRTSRARGLDYKTSEELQRNYYQECADDESEARNRLSKEKHDRRKADRDAKQSIQQEQQQTQMAQQQCDESKRIIASKKRRTDLNEGEMNELMRFEANIKARCS
jgi:hypothetical protein